MRLQKAARYLGVLAISLIWGQGELYAREAKQETKLDGLESRLGQLLMLGFIGSECTPQLQKLIRTNKPSSLILFSRNIKTPRQTLKMLECAQATAKKAGIPPLLIAVDQEGGNVIRIKQTPPMPSALALARTQDPEFARRIAYATGQLMRALGINTNLAPVVDVSDPETDEFIGTRSYGGSPETVARFAVAFAQGLQQAQILPVAKHFPGHGDASGDSHLGFAENQSALEQLKARDLQPYAQLQEKLTQPWAVMLAHVAFPKVDPSKRPASFSTKLVQDLLRKDLRLPGLVITDDIQMLGASKTLSLGERAVEALKAGSDLVMVSYAPKAQLDIITAIRRALQSGELSRERIREALGRIEAAQAVYAQAVPRAKEQPEQVLRLALKNPEFQLISDGVLQTLLRLHQSGRSPATSRWIELQSHDPIFVLTPRTLFADQVRRGFKARGSQRNIRFLRLDATQRATNLRSFRASPESPIIVYASGKGPAAELKNYPEEFRARMRVINVESRAALKGVRDFYEIIEVNYRHPQLGELIASHFIEPTRAEASTPVRLENSRRSLANVPNQGEGPSASRPTPTSP
jgi:beta-N-acetylhexosaminidase